MPPLANMVTGLVYTEVHGSTNQRREVFRVKRALTTKARKISRMHVGTSGNQTAYANKPGRTLLRSIQKMQTDILTLQKNGDDQNDEILTLQKNGDDQKDEILTLQKNVDDQKDEILILQKNGDDQKNKILTLQKKVDSQDSEIMILRPLKDTAIDIRKRFFATYRRRVDEMEAEDKPTIDDGNLRAHAGDVCLDVSLFKNHFIECEDTFSTLYGLSWLEAQSLFGYEKLVCAMNARATTLTNKRLWWKPEQEVAFRNLLLWIGNATTDELETFNEGIDKETYPQLLLKSMGLKL